MSSHIKIAITKTQRRLLRLFYSFDYWHISPLEERPYAKDVIAFCNTHPNRNSFVEIGCGLGDIVRKVNFEKRIGYDMDLNVLKAARFLSWNGKEISFQLFRFPQSSLDINMNALTMINWIHHIEPSLLKDKIHGYFNNNLLQNGWLILDTVQDKAYKNNHDILFLSEGLSCAVEHIGSYARQRDIWAIKKIN
jgi:hypothetical protein